jgi:hypothetical protein
MTWQLKWREMCSLLQTVPSLRTYVCALFHLNMEIPSDPHCIRRIDQFIPYVWVNNSLLSLSLHKGLQRHPRIFCKNNPPHIPTERYLRAWYWGSMGARRLVNHLTFTSWVVSVWTWRELKEIKEKIQIWKKEYTYLCKCHVLLLT